MSVETIFPNGLGGVMGVTPGCQTSLMLYVPVVYAETKRHGQTRSSNVNSLLAPKVVSMVAKSVSQVQKLEVTAALTVSAHECNTARLHTTAKAPRVCRECRDPWASRGLRHAIASKFRCLNNGCDG